MENNLTNIEKRYNSYITKDELINMINDIHFEVVENLHMNLITGYLVKNNPIEPEIPNVIPLYYTIDIS